MTNYPRAMVLIADGRSGTNFLISKLLQTGKVNFGREPFNQGLNRGKDYGAQNGLDIAPAVIDKMNDAEFRTSDPEGYIDYCAGFTGALNGTGTEVSGFKVFPSHNPEIFWKMTKDPRFSPIILQRRSVLAVYSSLLIALKTRKWEQLRTDQKTVEEPVKTSLLNALKSRKWLQSRGGPKVVEEQVKVHFDAKAFEEFRCMYIGRFLRAEDNMRRNGIAYCKTYYEDLVADEKELIRVFAFLGLKPDTTTDSPLVVQNTTKVLDRFENPEDARPYLEQKTRDERENPTARGKLMFHIGPPKTGTTALQLALQKVEVPKFTYLGTFQSRAKNNPAGVFPRLMEACGTDAKDDFISRLLYTLDARLADGHDLLISDEMFLVDHPMATFQEKLKRLSQICRRFEPEVITTPREPIFATKSLYDELYFRQKTRVKIDFETFVKGNQAKIYDYTYLLAVLNDCKLNNIRQVKIAPDEVSIPLSHLTGTEYHTQKLDLTLYNEMKDETQGLICQLDIPKNTRDHLTKGFRKIQA